MSSSTFHPPPHLHRVNLQKRPFEEYDSDADSAAMPIQPTTSSGTSSSSHNHRFSAPARPETRNKRARSTSSTSTDDPSSSSGYNTAQSSSRSDISSDVPPASTTNCPAPSQDVHMTDLHLPVAPAQPQRTTPPTPEDTLRTSLQRFAEFDRQIAALRTSLAATRSPPLPPSVAADPGPHWHLHSSDPALSTVAVAPLATFNTHLDSTAPATVPSASFSPTFSNIPRYPPYPSYRPPLPSPAVHERVGDANSTPPLMRPSPIQNTTRSSDSAPSHIRHPRRNLIPLVLVPDPPPSPPSSVVADDVPRYRTPYGNRDPVHARSHQSPVPAGESSRLGDHSTDLPRLSSQPRPGERARVIREHSAERESVPSVFDLFNIGESSQDRNRPSSVATPRYTANAESVVPPRVPGTHNERPNGPAPNTTAVNTSQVPQDLHARLHSSSWTSIPSSNSLMSESASERRRALALERFRARLRRSSFDADDESDSRWSGSSRGERNAGGRDPSLVSPMPPSPSVESVSGTGSSMHFPPLTAPPSTANRAEPAASTSLQRSFSELFAEAQRIAREEEGVAREEAEGDPWLLDWEAERERQEREREQERQRQGQERSQDRMWDWEREREREWERQRERSVQDIRGRSFASGSSLASMSSARDESSHHIAPVPRPSVGQIGAGPSTTTPPTTNNQQYSYSNLNLASFQSGLFRDSLRRNAEVDQASFSSSGPISMTTGLGLDDSESEMDLDDLVRTRPPSPEWSRPQPYAGRTPPPDYSPPPRNFSLRPGSFALRRGSVVQYNPQGRTESPNRNSAAFTRPAPPVPPVPTRPSTYENNSRPAPPERTERDRFLPARILETFYRSHEDGRRNASAGTGQPFHAQHQSRPLAPVSRNERNDGMNVPRRANGGNGSRTGTEVGENRRGSLGLGGSLRSRIARLANPNPQSSVNAAEVTSRQRSPSHPIGARPQMTEQQHRRGSSAFGGNVLEDVRGPHSHWAVNATEPVMPREVPWRAASGPRNAFVPPPPPPPANAGRTENPEGTNRAEEHRSRLRTLRQRLQLDRGGEGVRMFRPGMLRAAIGRRANLGDYVPDELFDDSYEALLSLSSMLGEVRSRATPDEVIASLPTGTFKEWKRDDSETRCPICLDDYEPSDVLTKLIECTHWLHKNCLEQWLRTANTCPVCREKVKASPKPAPARRRPTREVPSSSETNHGASSSSSGNRPPPTNPQSNTGRPVSFAAMVFDHLMNEGRDVTAESLPLSSSSQAAPPTRDTRNVLFERLRTQQQQQQQQPPSHLQPDVYVPFPPPHEMPHHFRVPPTSQPGLSRPATDGRPFGFVSLRGQGSDSSTSTNSSVNMIVDDVGARPDRRSTAGGYGSGSGPSLFPDVPTPNRRESVFYAPPLSSSAFGAPQPSSFDVHPGPPPVVISSSTESTRDWRHSRMYDAVLDAQGSRSLSSSSSSSTSSGPVSAGQSRPSIGMASRIPVEEDSPFEEFMFPGWGVRRRVGDGSY